MSDRCQTCNEVPNPDGRCACPDTIRCDHCKQLSDIQALPKANFKHPVMPRTLTNLPDHNNVDWLCPKCGTWNLTEEID